MTAPEPKTYDGSIGDLVKALINALIVDAHDKRNEPSELERIRRHIADGASNDAIAGVSALTAYMTARAAERQAAALETIAKTAAKLERTGSSEVSGQAIIDQRESKREYLATTYSLPTHVLTLLWSIRGVLVDASLKALSKPERFEPYLRVSTDDIAWTLRLTPERLIECLPRNDDGSIDYDLLREFDIMHYGGTDQDPDDWMYGG